MHKYINYIPKKGYSQNVISHRKKNFAKQNEKEHDDWADVEWHKSCAKNINSPKLSHVPPRTSKPCRQNNTLANSFLCLSNVKNYIFR